MARKLVREAIIEALIAEGVDHVFGLPGGQSVNAITDPIYDHKNELTSVLAHDERSGAFMACGYTQMSKKPSMCYGTLGPGFSNLLPGMYEAYRSCWPVIFMAPSAPTPTFGFNGMQEVPQLEIVRPLMKWAFRLDMPNKVNWMMRNALSEACSGIPGPVYIEIPTEMGGVECDVPAYEKSTRATDFEPSDASVEATMKAIMAAEKPVIIAGHGVHMSQAHAELLEFAELMGVVVASTGQGKAAIAEDHPLAIGPHGHIGSQWTNEYVDTCDLVFWIGSAMEDLSTHVFTRGRGTGKLICSNVNPSHMFRCYAPDIALVGDAKLTLAKLTAKAKAMGEHKPYMERANVKALLEEKKDWEAATEAEWESFRGKAPMEVGRAAEELAKHMPDNVMMVPDSGFNSFFSQAYPNTKLLKAGNNLMHSENYFIGFSLPAAIGASYATDDPIVSIVGDGGFHFVMPEVATAVQYKRPIMMVVMDNEAIGWIKYWQKVMCDGRYCDTDFATPIDFAKVAEACGCQAVTIEKEEDLAGGFEKAFAIQAKGEPVLVHCKVHWDTNHWGSNYTTDMYKTGGVASRAYAGPRG